MIANTDTIVGLELGSMTIEDVLAGALAPTQELELV